MAERRERLTSKDTLARGRNTQPRQVPKLSDLGVTKTQSSRWRRLADVAWRRFTRRSKSSREMSNIPFCEFVVRSERSSIPAWFRNFNAIEFASP
jgi:hypothetical protein